MGARDKLVLSTIDLVRRHGVAGTGIAAILEHGDVSVGRSTSISPRASRSSSRKQHGWPEASSITRSQPLWNCPPPGLTESVRRVVERRRGGQRFRGGMPHRRCRCGPLHGTRDRRHRWADVRPLARRDRRIAPSPRSRPGHRARPCERGPGCGRGAVVMAIAQRSLRPLDDVRDQLIVLVGHHLDASAEKPRGRKSTRRE